MNKCFVEENRNLKNDIENIKETAVRTLMDKDGVIIELEERIKKYEESDYSN